jgi:hypothetical protein
MAFLLVLMVNTLFASIVGDALGSIVGSSLDMAASDYATVVQIDGQEIGFGGKGIASLKRTFKQHDFSQVSYQQRQEIYGKAQISLGWPAWKNLLVGFGAGSKLQGDFGGMLFGQISDWTTLTIAGAGLGVLLLDFLFIQIFNTSSGSMQLNNPDDPFNQLGIAAMAIGGGAFAVGRLIQALSSYVWSSLQQGSSQGAPAGQKPFRYAWPRRCIGSRRRLLGYPMGWKSITESTYVVLE